MLQVRMSALLLLVSGCAASGGGTPRTNVQPDAAATRDAAVNRPSVEPRADAVASGAPESPDAGIAADAAVPTPTPAGLEARRTSFLAMLRAIAGSVPLDPRLEPATTEAGMSQQELTFASTPTWRVPGTLRRRASAKGRLPVAICLHATGSDRDSANIVSLATKLAGRGFLTVAISGRYFGAGGGNDAYVAAMKAAYTNPGGDYPFLYDTAWDVTRLVDYLVTRDDVDPARIGLLGISKGGMETVLAAAIDPRIAAAAPIIGVQSFKWGLEHEAFRARADSLGGAVPDAGNAASVRTFYDRVAPGLVDRYDDPDMLPLIAPRPLVVISGTQDPRNAITGVELAVGAARAQYAKLGADAKLVLFTANVGHDGSYGPFHDQAIAWMVRWLLP
jgi:dienelactone hydrolase